MTPGRWIILWAIIFVFTPLLFGLGFGSYLLGTSMGAVLFIGFAAMEGR
jgi:hypothetical protein